MAGFGCVLSSFLIAVLIGYSTGTGVKPETKVYHDLIGLVPDSVLDSRMKASFKDVVQFADKIFSRVDKLPTHPLPINLGLLRLYALHTDLAPIPAPELDLKQDLPDLIDAPAQIPEELVAEALHYYGFAVQAYNANPRIIQQDIMLNNLPDKQTSNIKMPRHVVFLDHITRSIVISVRGTASVSDMLTDLYIEPYPFLEPSRNLFAHHGMAESAETLLPLVTAAIHEIRQRTYTASTKSNKSPLTNLLHRKSKKLYKYSDYRVVVTGHSLGAGTASLLAILLCMKSNITATAFAYAPPPVVSTLREIPHSKPRKWQPPFKMPFVQRQPTPSYQIHSFVHNNDIISRSSHTQILSLVSALSAVDQLPWGALERAGMLLRNSLTPAEISALHEALTHRKHFIEGNDRELYIPGDIYLLRPSTEGLSRNASADRGVHVAKPAEEDAKLNATSQKQEEASDTITRSLAGRDEQVEVVDAHTSARSDVSATTLTAVAAPQVTFDLFGTSITTQLPQLPPLPQLPQLPPQLLEALQNLLGAASDSSSVPVMPGSTAAATTATDATPGMDTFHAQNTVPSTNQTDVASRSDKNNVSGANYRCVRVADPRKLFNGLMYYGDGMVYDHLTAPFERALLLLTSVN